MARKRTATKKPERLKHPSYDRAVEQQRALQRVVKIQRRVLSLTKQVERDAERVDTALVALGHYIALRSLNLREARESHTGAGV